MCGLYAPRPLWVCSQRTPSLLRLCLSYPPVHLRTLRRRGWLLWVCSQHTLSLVCLCIPSPPRGCGYMPHRLYPLPSALLLLWVCTWRTVRSVWV